MKRIQLAGEYTNLFCPRMASLIRDAAVRARVCTRTTAHERAREHEMRHQQLLAAAARCGATIRHALPPSARWGAAPAAGANLDVTPHEWLEFAGRLWRRHATGRKLARAHNDGPSGPASRRRRRSCTEQPPERKTRRRTERDLVQQAVFPATREHYWSEIYEFEAWARQEKMDLDTDQEIANTMAQYFNRLCAEGESPQVGRHCFYGFLIFRRTHLWRDRGALGTARAALLGWSRLSPTRVRDPAPTEVAYVSHRDAPTGDQRRDVLGHLLAGGHLLPALRIAGHSRERTC